MDIVDRVTRWLATIMVIAIWLIMLGQVFARYVLNSSLQWSEVACLYLLAWATFFGAAIVMRTWNHISIPTFVNLFPLRARAFVLIFNKSVTLLFFLMIVFYGIEVFNAKFHTFMWTLGLSSKWMKLAVPVGSAIMILYLINLIIADLVAVVRRRFDHFATQAEVPLD